jgi:Ni/Co efflux regulator RcnB
MPDLKQMRNRLKIAIAVLVLVDVLAVVMLMTPVAGSAAQREQELQQSWLQLKARESAPWRGLDKKIPIAKQQIEDFYRDRFPSEASSVSEDLAVVADRGALVGGQILPERFRAGWAGADGN